MTKIVMELGVTVRMDYKICYAVGSYSDVSQMYHPTGMDVTVKGRL